MHPACEHRHTPTCAHARTHSCTHTCGGHMLRVCPAWHTPPSPASPPAMGQLKSRGRGWPPAIAPSLPPERETARELGRGVGSGDLDIGEPRNVLGSLLGLLHFVLFSGKQMEKISPFPHFWRLICINRPDPITFRVNRETVRSRALGPGPRAGGDQAFLVLPGLLLVLKGLNDNNFMPTACGGPARAPSA